jgi:hypothetical protein
LKRGRLSGRSRHPFEFAVVIGCRVLQAMCPCVS